MVTEEERKKWGWAPPVYDPTFHKELRVTSRENTDDAHVSQQAEDSARDAEKCRFESCREYLTDDTDE